MQILILLQAVTHLQGRLQVVAILILRKLLHLLLHLVNFVADDGLRKVVLNCLCRVLIFKLNLFFLRRIRVSDHDFRSVAVIPAVVELNEAGHLQLLGEHTGRHCQLNNHFR